MLGILSPTSSSSILQAIDVANENGFVESSGNKMILSNLFVSTRSTKAGYPTFGGAKKGGGNTKKGIKAARGSNSLTSAAKKAFNYLRYVFIQAPILPHFDLERHIRIETNASSYAIGGVLNQLTLEDLGW